MKRNKKFGRKGTRKLIRNNLQEKEINKIRIEEGNIKEQRERESEIGIINRGDDKKSVRAN